MIRKEDILAHFNNAYPRFYERFLELRHKSGTQLMALCPFHADTNPSLSIDPKTGLWKCFGCNTSGDIFTFYQKLKDHQTFQEVLMGISQEFGIAKSVATSNGKVVATYDYVDEEGKLLFQVCRRDPKDFRQRKPNGKGGWQWNTNGVRRVLYNLPKVLQADEVIIVEGEKDTDALIKLDLTATTNPGGAGKWKNEYAEFLTGKDVVLIPDNDEPGKKHMAEVGKSLRGKARSIKWLELPGVPQKGDLSCWLSKQQDHEAAVERLSILIENAELFNPNLSKEPLPTASFIIDYLREDIKRNKGRGSLGINPGFEFLKNAIRGFIPGHLWVVGGYTSHGKTAFAIELISRVLSNDPNVRITLFSTEMSKETYILRLVAKLTGIPSLSLWEGNHIQAFQARVDEAFDLIAHKNLIVFDDLYEFEKMADKARQIKAEVGLDLLFIDFIQNLIGKGATIYERMSILAPQVQALAKELSCTVVALSQVSNEAVRNNSGVIGYKGAGEIAAAADLGLWLEREREGNDGFKINSEILNVIIKKNRHGPLGHSVLRFYNKFTGLKDD